MSTLFASDAQALVNEQGQKVIIPEIYTSIADQAFLELQLTSVEIPGSISTIGQNAFYANQLENIVIADGVQSIGYLAFGSNQLTSVDVPDSVTTISDFAFYENQLTSIEIPNSVTWLGGGAFSFNQLSSVDIPESLSSILSQVFFGNKLTNIAIPNGVSAIGDRAFSNNQLTRVDIPESVRIIGAAAFFENALTSIVLPTNLIEIKQNAFRNNQLTTVEIPDSVVEIGNNAFLGNPLERISISEDASFDLSVYEDAGVEIIFRNINAPTDLAISTTDLDSTYILGGGGVVARFNTTDADTNDTFTYTLITGEGDTDNGEFSIEGDELTIQTSPDYETKDSYSIRVRTTDSEGLGFEKVFELMVFHPPDILLTRDNANTLVNDQGIDVIIPDRYEAIDDNAFERKQLNSVAIPESITAIGSYAFFNNRLTRVDIPDSVTSIGKFAFNGNQLTSVSFGDNLSLIDDYAFRANELESLILPNSIRLIGENAFSANNLSSVKIPDGVMEIGREAFWDNQLESIIIPNSVQLIGPSAFAENQLIDVEISDSVSVISAISFRGNQLTSVEIPDGVTEIGSGSFTRNQLTDVEIANSVTAIGSYAFSRNQLTDIYIPDSVNSIGEFAFQYNPLEIISVSGDVSFDFSYYEQFGTEIIIRNSYVPPTDITLSASSFGEDLIRGSVVASFNTVDDDTNDRFTYSLVNGDGDTDNSIFIIEGDQLKITASPDHETQESYSIRVQAEDSGGLTFEKAFTFFVNDLNEDPTNLLISASTFDENITADSVVATFSSTDPDDGDTFTYSLIPGSGDTDNSIFTIDGDKLIINESPNYEAQSTYSIRLQTKDSGGKTLKKQFTFQVNARPTGTLSITGTATQGQTLTADVSAIADLDGLGTFSYQWLADGTPITGATASTFELTQDQVGKAITVVASYTDGGGTVESLSSAATNAVTNSNDAPVINPGGSDLTGEVTEDGVDDQSDSNDSPPEPDSPVLTVNQEESDNGGSVVINPESIPQGDETLVISSSNLPEDTQPIFELSGGVDSTVNLSIDFQKIGESSTPINTNQSTDGGGSIASNAPQNLTLNLDGVYFNSGAGDDSIIGAQFNDFLRAGAGDDIIDAGGGNDIVRAGTGSDRITLGSGSDTLYLTTDQLDGSTDVLTDFNSAEDRIVLSENLTVSLAGNIATFTTEIDDVERSTQLIFSGFDSLSDQWFSVG